MHKTAQEKYSRSDYVFDSKVCLRLEKIRKGQVNQTYLRVWAADDASNMFEPIFGLGRKAARTLKRRRFDGVNRRPNELETLIECIRVRRACVQYDSAQLYIRQ